MPVSARHNIHGKYIGNAATRAAYAARWARWARLYAAGVAVGGARLAAGTSLAGLAATGAYYGYKMLKRKRISTKRRKTTRRRPSLRMPVRRTFKRRAPYKKSTRPMKRRRIVKRTGGGQGGQLTSTKIKYGAKRTIKPARFVREATDYIIQRYQGVNRLNYLTADTAGQFPGYYPMYFVNSSTTDQNSKLPVHIIALNRNQKTAENAFHRELQLTNSNATLNSNDQFQWLPLAGQGWNSDNTPTTVIDFVTEHDQKVVFDSNAAVKGQPRIRAVYYDIRLMLHGCRTQPTVWDIMYVSFTNELVGMFSNGGALNDDMWKGFVKDIVYNPIMPGHPGSMKYMKVHRKWRYTIQPSVNTDLDTNPESKMVKLFIRDGRILDYSQPHIADGTFNNDEDAILGAVYSRDNANSETYDDPMWKHRRFLIIRAMNTTAVTAAASTRANTPSYDLVYRRRLEAFKFY